MDTESSVVLIKYWRQSVHQAQPVGRGGVMSVWLSSGRRFDMKVKVWGTPGTWWLSVQTQRRKYGNQTEITWHSILNTAVIMNLNGPILTDSLHTSHCSDSSYLLPLVRGPDQAPGKSLLQKDIKAWYSNMCFREKSKQCTATTHLQCMCTA